MAECHPVGFQWVMEAKARGATVIHVDPRFTRTSALADLHLPLRAGSDIVFLGGIINYVLAREKYFRDYVLNYTNAATLLTEDFADTEDLDGVFSGLDREHRHYDFETWRYQGAEVSAAAGNRDRPEEPEEDHGPARREVRRAGRGEAHGSGAPRRTRMRTGTRRCSTRGACSRCSSAISRATPRSWSSRPAGSRRRRSAGSAS